MIEKIYNHSCTLCPLHKTVPLHEWICVSGSGDWTSRALILGEAPGKNESEKGVPFIGRAGEILDQALLKAGTTRKSVFTTNTVKCRPPDNRKPDISEEEACRMYLKREIEIVDPIAVLALGNHALRASTGLWGITKYVGVWQEVPRSSKASLLVLPNYHPAYVLYNRSSLELFEETVYQFVTLIRSQSSQSTE
jgi:DNA polymerase